MDRSRIENHLADAERHVIEGEHHVLKQREIIALMSERGHSTTDAERLLQTLEESQRLHLTDRERLRQELAVLKSREHI